MEQMIQGFIDVVKDDFIIDWKTNRKYYNVQKNHQIALYSWAMSRIKKIPEIYGSLYFLRFRREERLKFTHKEMEDARLWALNLAKEVQNKLSLVESIPGLKEDLFPINHQRFAVIVHLQWDVLTDLVYMRKAVPNKCDLIGYIREDMWYNNDKR